VPLASERGRKRERLRIGEPHVAALESACDAYNERVAPLTSFVLSGGTPQAATLHHARTVCRRAERHVIRLGAREDVGGPTIAYLNRLSDLLFLLARVHNDEGRADVLWEPGGSLPKD
jgi:cob(I)alamin adenosyltransferase